MDWFKMQTVWGASVERLSDAEAGRFIKVLYAYVRNGEEYSGSSGREDPITWQALEALRGDVESFKKIEADQKAKEDALHLKRQEAANARWKKQTDANECKSMQNDAFASTSIICNAFASQNKNKNVIKETTLTSGKEKRTRFSPPTVDEVAAYCKERGNKIDAQYFVDYYATREWVLSSGQKVKDWRACIRTWEQRDNGQAVQKPKLLRAQMYQQREYNEKEMQKILGVDDLYLTDEQYMERYGVHSPYVDREENAG